MRAYILVSFETKTDLSKVKHALNRPGIAAIDLVMGPYDAIVSCETADFAALAQLAKDVRGCPGIRDSITCPAV